SIRTRPATTAPTVKPMMKPVITATVMVMATPQSNRTKRTIMLMATLGNSGHQQLTHTTVNGRAREKGRAGGLEASRSRRGWNRLRTVAATSEQSVLSFIANRSSFLIGELLLGKLSETVVVQGNAPHNCPCGLVCHLIGNRAGFLCTEAPMLRI